MCYTVLSKIIASASGVPRLTGVPFVLGRVKADFAEITKVKFPVDRWVCSDCCWRSRPLNIGTERTEETHENG